MNYNNKVKVRLDCFCSHLQNPEQRKAVSFFAQKCLLVTKAVWFSNSV